MMTLEKMENFIKSFKLLRELVTDELAAQVPDVYPAWRTEVSYSVGARVSYDGDVYTVLTSHTSQEDWTPDAAPSLFAKVLIPDTSVIPDWEQPDSTNAYHAGDKVTHGGKIWVSNMDGNVWEPGVYGWTEVSS